MPDALKCDAAYDILKKFLADNPEYVGDAKVYSHEAWLARGEPYGRNSLATMVIDGSPMYGIMNGHAESTPAVALDAALAAQGFYVELGFAWTLHAYEI